MLKEAAGIRKVVIKLGKTDLRRGIDGLVSIISFSGGMDPLEEGTLYLFCGTKNDRIKGLIYEGDGYLLLTKRLSGKNRFQWPRNADEMKMITRKQYDNLMDGFSVESTIHPVPREEEDKKRAAVEKTQKKTNLFSKKACKKAEPPL